MVPTLILRTWFVSHGETNRFPVTFRSRGMVVNEWNEGVVRICSKISVFTGSKLGENKLIRRMK